MGNLADEKKLKKFMDEKRFIHTLGVVEAVKTLAPLHDIQTSKAVLAATFHDLARCLEVGEMLNMAKKFNLVVDPIEQEVPDLLHGKVGAELARREFGICDEEVLNAIRRHTLGEEYMSPLDKLLFVADMIEPNRDYPGVEQLRYLALKDLDMALLAGLNSTISYVIKYNGVIHTKSIEARNQILLSMKNHGQEL